MCYCLLSPPRLRYNTAIRVKKEVEKENANKHTQHKASKGGRAEEDAKQRYVAT